jgi:hypothetical protein
MKQYEPHREVPECANSAPNTNSVIGDSLAVAEPPKPFHVCYAPVFRESSPFFCLLLAILNGIALLFLLLIFLFTRNPGILCAIRRIQYRLKHCGEGNSDPGIVLLDPYAEHVHSWRMTYGKDAVWEQWMLDNRSRYEPVYQRAAAKPSTLVMAFRYFAAPIAYNPPWSIEAEHMAALETYMELAFPGYNFLFQFNGNTTSSYANVIAGIPTNASQQSGKNVSLYYETIINHEFAHVMAVLHHYDTPADIGNGQHMPPGETQCIMDRTINQFCSACRTALMIPLNVDNAATIASAGNNISSRYPY